MDAGKTGKYSNDIALFFVSGKLTAHVGAFKGLNARARARGSIFESYFALSSSFDEARNCHAKLTQIWNARSRVYLVGHGNWRARTLAGHTPSELTLFLRQAQMPRVKLISIVACSLGAGPMEDADLRIRTASHDHRIENSARSFGAEFYKSARVFCERLAVRTLSTLVDRDTGQKLTVTAEAEDRARTAIAAGLKPADPMRSKAPASKLIYSLDEDGVDAYPPKSIGDEDFFEELVRILN